MTTLLLLTSNPDTQSAVTALQLAQALARRAVPLQIFIYQAAAQLALQTRWQAADRLKLAQGWLDLAQTYHFDLPVCVSAGLYRGVSDQASAERHTLPYATLLPGFHLVGLGELVSRWQQADRVIRL